MMDVDMNYIPNWAVSTLNWNVYKAIKIFDGVLFIIIQMLIHTQRDKMEFAGLWNISIIWA